jgi:hypothetical protein
MPERARFAPAERSISEEIITKAAPTAITDTSAVCRPMLAKFPAERKTGDARLKPTSREPPELHKEIAADPVERVFEGV